jgi:hypothetical protein
MFNKSLIAAALLTVIAASAFAQSYDPDIGSGNIAVAPGSVSQVDITYLRGRDAYAQAPDSKDRREVKGQFGTTGADEVWFDRAKGHI